MAVQYAHPTYVANYHMLIIFHEPDKSKNKTEQKIDNSWMPIFYSLLVIDMILT